MRQLLIILFVCLVSLQSYSQDYSFNSSANISSDSRTPNYKYSFGMKVSPPTTLTKAAHYGYISVASFRLFFDNKTAWESNVILDPEQWQINAFYQKYIPLSKGTYKGFRFYWAAGVEYGMNFSYKQRHRSIGSFTGIDYTFKNKRIPYAITLDVGPYIIDVFSKMVVEVRPNLGIRYCFNY